MALSLDVGAGHRMAAEALRQALEVEAPGTVFQIEEGLEILGPRAGKLARDLYLGVVEELPDLWGSLYAEKTLARWLRPFAEMVDEFRCSSLTPRIRAFEPDLIIALHPLMVGLASALARQEGLPCPLAVVLTDFDAHPAWIGRGVDLYLVATEAVATDLARHEIPTGRVITTGIPLRRPFEGIRALSADGGKWGLDPAKVTVLLLGGGLGLGPLVETARALRGLDGPVQVVMVAGGNEELRAEAEKLAEEPGKAPLVVLGRVEAMWELISLADVVVGKTGGLTCAEVMAAGKPMVALDPIPGQEVANARALEKAGAACRAEGADEALRRVRRLVEDYAHRDALGRAARAFGRPTAGTLAARALLRLVADWDGLRQRRPRRGDADPFSTESEPFRAFDDLVGDGGSLDEAELDEIRSRHETEAALDDVEVPIMDVDDDELLKGPSEVDTAFEDMVIDAELAEMKRRATAERGGGGGKKKGPKGRRKG